MQQEPPRREALGVHGNERPRVTPPAPPEQRQRKSVAEIIRTLRPGESEEAIDHRVAFNNLAVLAANSAVRLNSPHARELAWQVHRAAASWVCRGGSEEKLRRARQALLMMTCAADHLEQVESGL